VVLLMCLGRSLRAHLQVEGRPRRAQMDTVVAQELHEDDDLGSRCAAMRSRIADDCRFTDS